MLKINEYFYHLQGKDLFVHTEHSHNEIEFIQVISGNGIVVKNDKTYVLKPQHLYVIDARNTHIVYPQPENCTDYIRNKIVIDANSFINHYSEIGMDNIMFKLFNSNPVPTAQSPEIDRIYKTVSTLCSSQRSENISFAHGYITELIHWIYLHSQSNPLTETGDTFQKMLSIINEKDGLTSLGEISEKLRFNKHYLCRLFKEKTGITISNYLSAKVYAKSRALLESTTYSIEEIAIQCGFSSQASFSRFFKNQGGISPLKHRKKFCMSNTYTLSASMSKEKIEK